jgi:hypothetical protein
MELERRNYHDVVAVKEKLARFKGSLSNMIADAHENASSARRVSMMGTWPQPLTHMQENQDQNHSRNDDASRPTTKMRVRFEVARTKNSQNVE